jgi:hypothetical protein
MPPIRKKPPTTSAARNDLPGADGRAPCDRGR